MTPLKKGDLIKSCKYTFIRERPAIGIDAFKNHRRLKVFFHKGFSCVTPNCNNVGTRLIYTIAKNGSHHWDLFTDDLVLMTIDHIIAKKNGGGNELENLQPMCSHCNTLKGHQVISLEELSEQRVVWDRKQAIELERQREIKAEKKRKQKARKAAQKAKEMVA